MTPYELLGVIVVLLLGATTVRFLYLLLVAIVQFLI